MATDQPALVRCEDCRKVLTGRLDEESGVLLSSDRSCPVCGGDSFERVEEGVHDVDPSAESGAGASGNPVD